MIDQIEHLRGAIKGLEAEIQRHKDRLEEWKQELTELESPWKVGQIITFGRKRIERGRIVGSRSFCGSYDPIVIVIRKDGTEGQTKCIYSWLNPKPE